MGALGYLYHRHMKTSQECNRLAKELREKEAQCEQLNEVNTKLEQNLRSTEDRHTEEKLMLEEDVSGMENNIAALMNMIDLEGQLEDERREIQMLQENNTLLERNLYKKEQELKTLRDDYEEKHLSQMKTSNMEQELKTATEDCEQKILKQKMEFNQIEDELKQKFWALKNKYDSDMSAERNKIHLLVEEVERLDMLNQRQRKTIMKLEEEAGETEKDISSMMMMMTAMKEAGDENAKLMLELEKQLEEEKMKS